MRRQILTLTALCAAWLGGCGASQPDRTEILVATAPPGASCILLRQGQPIATAAPTPAIALVEPSPDEIAISCRRQGFADAAVTLPPAPPARWFAPVDYQRRVDIALVPR
jgi:hypothetical protein